MEDLERMENVNTLYKLDVQPVLAWHRHGLQLAKTGTGPMGHRALPGAVSSDLGGFAHAVIPLSGGFLKLLRRFLQFPMAVRLPSSMRSGRSVFLNSTISHLLMPALITASTTCGGQIPQGSKKPMRGRTISPHAGLS